MTSHYPVVLEHEPNGTVSAYVVGLPGVFAAADSERAAASAIRVALRAHLAAHISSAIAPARPENRRERTKESEDAKSLSPKQLREQARFHCGFSNPVQGLPLSPPSFSGTLLSISPLGYFASGSGCGIDAFRTLRTLPSSAFNDGIAR